MKRLHYFTLWEDKKEDENKQRNKPPKKQNDIPDSPANSAVSLFSKDMGKAPITIDSIPGYNFIMASDKRELWLLEGMDCHLIGLGSPFGREDCVDFLNTLPDYAVAMLAERMEHYSFKESPDSFMFGINGTLRVFHTNNQDLYYIAYPNDRVQYDMVSDLNDQTVNDKFKAGVEKTIGNKMTAWVRKKIKLLQNE